MTTAPPATLPRTGEWWLLPSGRIVSIRRIEGDIGAAEAVVRHVDEYGAMSTGEFNLTMAFIARTGRKVGNDR